MKPNKTRGEIMKKTVFAVVLALVTMACASGILMAEEGVFHGGDITYSEPVKAVLFSHKTHVEDMGMGCDMCHAGLFDMAAHSVEQKGDFTMESLYQGKYCGSCHNGQFAFASDTQCARCHIGVKGYNALNSETDNESSH
jgi:c(7)-type cytochrome triheme protein